MEADVERFDVAVVGARCAGAPLALELARHGLRVCVLDRARFPSDTASTHVIQPRGVAVLDRLGLRADVESAGAVPVERFTLVTDDARIDPDPADPRLASILATDRPAGLCARRIVLDQVLVEAAAAAGADVRPGVGVTDLLRDQTGRVLGVHTDRGDIAASLVIGADGRSSTIARLAGARSYHAYRTGRVPSWGYFEGVADPERRLRIGVRAGLAFIACPTDAGLYLAGVAPSAADQAWFLADRERNFAALLPRWPELADLLAGARRVGPIRAMPDLAGFFREASGPGWVLTGDAGHFKDPTPAQGIADAFVQAERLAGVIAAHDLSDTAALDAALRDWWRWRDRDCYAMHWFARDMGAGGQLQPLTAEFLRGVAADPVAGAQLLQVLNREITPNDWMTAGRIVRAAGRVIRRRPRRIPAMVREIGRAARDEVVRAVSFRRSGPARPAPRSVPARS